MNTNELPAKVDWMDEARAIAAQCWCDEETKHIEMDGVLAEAIAKRIAAWMQTGAFHAGNEEYWHKRALAAEADRERQAGEAVAWMRDGLDGTEYCEKPFTTDWTPLYTLASLPAPQVQADNTKMWAVHIIGPDDVHAAPDREVADAACVALNWSFKRTGQDDLCRAEVIEWPHGYESWAAQKDLFRLAAAPSPDGKVEQAEAPSDVVAFEFYNPTTGHAIVDYTVNTHVGRLGKEQGYEARPLGYVNPPTAAVKIGDPVPLWQAREALDSLEESARGDAPYNHFAANIIRTALEQAATQPTASNAGEREALTDAQIEKLREQTFSTNNPFCPVDSKSMRKAVRAAEHVHGIKERS